MKKPIGFFYGEEYGEKEIQDLIAIIHKETPETRVKSIATMTMILQMFEIGERLTGNAEKEPTIEELKEFWKFIQESTNKDGTVLALYYDEKSNIYRTIAYYRSKIRNINIVKGEKIGEAVQ